MDFEASFSHLLRGIIRDVIMSGFPGLVRPGTLLEDVVRCLGDIAASSVTASDAAEEILPREKSGRFFLLHHACQRIWPSSVL